MRARAALIGALTSLLGGPAGSQPTLEAFDGLDGWEVVWTGQADGRAEAVDGVLAVETRYDGGLQRQGHSRLTMTRRFDRPRDLSALDGLALRVRVGEPLNTSLWLYLLEPGGVRYRADTCAKLRTRTDWETLLVLFSDFSWDFESAQDPNQQLDLDRIEGLRLMAAVGEGQAGRFAIDQISEYTTPPPPETDIIWVEPEGGSRIELPPGTELPADIELRVTVGQMSDLAAPRLRWEARDAWGKTIATDSADLRRAGEHSASVVVAFACPGYAEVDIAVVDGDEVVRETRYHVAALPLPTPEDAAPREDSIQGMWPGGYGQWVKLGVKWARTYCQPWDFEPRDDGTYRYVRKDAGGKPTEFAPNLEEGLNYICFFRGMPKWLSAQPGRADYWKFPPTDWDEWARFVRTYVGLMRDYIRVWEVWNEPVPYAYWMGTVEEVVKLHEVTYRAIHEVQPDAIVLGPCPYRIRLPFTERFYELGGGQWIDAVVTHAYCDQPDPDLADDLTWLRALLEKHGLQKDIWITEIGWSTRTHTELEQAENLVKTYAIGLQEGVHTITWHMNWDYDDPLLRGGHGLLRHTHQPKPGFAAYATFMRFMERAETEGTAAHDPGPEEPAIVYQFRKDGRRIRIAWARERGASWRPPAEEWQVRDMFGTPLRPNDTGCYPLTSSPLYAFERN